MGRVKLGDEAKDLITGFQGIVVGLTNWLNGCVRVGIQPPSLSEKGDVTKSEWFDEGQIEVLVPGKFNLNPAETPVVRKERAAQGPGGPDRMDGDARQEDPSR